MKTLVLVRHGKSSWKHPQLNDFERPLNDRGRRDTPKMAARFSAQPHKPSLMLSSYATRALTTARIFAQYLNYPLPQLGLSDSLYEAEVTDLLRVVEDLPDSHNSVALFGHNPGFTDLVNYLSAADLGNLPTAGIAVMTLPIESWQQINNDGIKGQGSLVYYSYPKAV